MHLMQVLVYSSSVKWGIINEILRTRLVCAVHIIIKNKISSVVRVLILLKIAWMYLTAYVRAFHIYIFVASLSSYFL